MQSITELFNKEPNNKITMNLKFLKIGNKGEDKEYILFQAVEDCNLHNYLIHDDTFDSDGELSNKLRHMYRFPSVSVKKGEFVALHVKQSGKYSKGTYKTALFKTEYPCHILYWGANTNIFNQDGDHLYLLAIAQTNRITIG